MKRVILAILLFGAAPAAAAPWEKSRIDWTKPPPATAEPTFRVPRGERFELANGVKVLVSTNRTLPLVSLFVIVDDAGAASDPAGLSGLAAFVGDLVDEGAGDLDALGIAAAADALGATVGAGAELDQAFVGGSTLPRTLPQTLELLAKIVTQPTFAAADVTRVHEDRMTEVALRRDSGSQVAALVANAMLYGRDTPYGRPVLGYEKELAKVTREQVLAFYASRWRPESVTIVVVGDVSLAEVRPHLEKSFGSWRPGPAPALAAPPKARAFAPPSRLILVERPNAEQSDVRFTIRGPKFGGPDTASLEVARTVLGGMFTSRLTRRIREQLGYAYTIRASWPARRAASPITVGAGFFTPKTADAIKEVLAIVGGMSAKPIPEEELRRGQQYLIRGFPQEFETNAGVAGSLANLVLLGLPDDYYERYLADLAKVTPKDVQRVAKTYFPVAKLTLVIVGDLGKAMPGVRKLKLGRETKVEQEANPVK